MQELEKLYFSQLERVTSIEDQIINMLPKLSEQASSQKLKDALDNHLEETKEHKQRLRAIFSLHDYTPRDVHVESFAALLSETQQTLDTLDNGSVKDAFITANAQVVEHLEQAHYTTLINWADKLDDERGEDLLEDTLSEESSASKKLSSIARGGMLRSGVDKKAAKA